MKSLEALTADAEELETSGNDRAALAVWRELMDRRPEPTTLCRFARVAIELGNLDEAETALRRATDLDSSLSEAYLALGSLSIDKRNNEEAEQLLRLALEGNRCRAGFCLLGVVLSRQGKKNEAEAAYREALAVDPNFDEACYNLGVLLREKDPSEAERLFAKALRLDPTYASAHRELGWLLRHPARPKHTCAERSSLNQRICGHTFTSEIYSGEGIKPRRQKQNSDGRRKLHPSLLCPCGPSLISTRTRRTGK